MKEKKKKQNKKNEQTKTGRKLNERNKTAQKKQTRESQPTPGNSRLGGNKNNAAPPKKKT